MQPSRLAGIFVVAALAVACGTSINSDIRVAQGERRSGGLNTVNGRIVVGADGTVDGGCKTVNGAIELGDGATVGGAATVNGSIRGGERVTVGGDVESVNGSVRLAADSRVDGEVFTINGGIELTRTVVARDLRTVYGDIALRDGATVEGDVVYEKKRGSGRSQKKPFIVLIEDSVVEGDLIVEDAGLQVQVVLRDGGQVLGRIENAEVVNDATSAGL